MFILYFKLYCFHTYIFFIMKHVNIQKKSLLHYIVWLCANIVQKWFSVFSNFSAKLACNSRNTRLQRDFPRPSGEWHHRRHLWAPSALPLGRLRRPIGKPPPSVAVKKNKFGAPPALLSWGYGGTPNVFKNVIRSMRIPSMCLVLKSDNWNVVSIANGQNQIQNHRIIQYRIST